MLIVQEKQAKVAKLEETIRALDMEVTGIKRSSSSVNSSRLKLVELLNRIQDASKQTAQKLEQNQAEQKVLEVRSPENSLIALYRYICKVRRVSFQ